MSEYLAQRTTNAANVSVGTSLALETILPQWPVFDPSRVAPPKVKLLDYQFALFNLWTLARNLQNSIPLEGRNTVSPMDAGEALAEEALEIIRTIDQATAGSVRVVIYYPMYNDLKTKFPKGKLRGEEPTPKQQAAQALLEGMCNTAAKILDRDAPKSFKRFSGQIGSMGFGNAIMFTHFPIDLLSEKYFGKLSLLESHTGVVKNKNLWYTKLFSGKNYPNIPFNQLTLQVFGDDHQFRPWESKIKQAVVELGQKFRWSWATTGARMRQDVGTHPDKIFAMALSNLL